MAQRRAKPGSGSASTVLREAASRYAAGVVFPDLKQVRFAVVGGLAAARYMPERMTLDTDLLIQAGDLVDAEKLLLEAGCEHLGGLAIGGSTWRTPEGCFLDLIALDQPWVSSAIASAAPDEKGVPYVDLPFLVIMKLESGRLQDLADISRMLGYAGNDALGAVRNEVGRYRPQDLEDLESMIQLGRLEHASVEPVARRAPPLNPGGRP